MPVFRLAAAVLALALAAHPAHAELPPEAQAATEADMGLCREAGGDPQITPWYESSADLNGDGMPDFLTNLTGLDCVGAWTIFCGSAGCPVTAWLSQPGGGHAPFNFGHLQEVEIVPAAAGGLPAVRASYHGAFCGEGRAGVDGCVRIWTFPAGNEPVEQGASAAAPAPAEVAQAAPEPAAPEPAAPPPAAEPVAPGWTLREVPGSTPVALGGGTGEIAWFAGFCLQGQPFLTLMFAPARTAETVTLRFAFSEGPVDAPALLEPTAGGAHVIALAGSPLAGRLAGRDSRVPVVVDGTEAGTLSLSGSTRALRAALGSCLRF